MHVRTLAAAALVAGAPVLVAMGSAMIQSGSALQAQQVTASSPHAKAERFDGQSIFRYDTFGDEQLWTGVLRMHEVVAKVSPATALAVGLKVDVDALPAGVVTAIRQHAVVVDNDRRGYRSGDRHFAGFQLWPRWCLASAGHWGP